MVPFLHKNESMQETAEKQLNSFHKPADTQGSSNGNV